jgi:NSS family neurotransmitter:Na+ symporter
MSRASTVDELAMGDGFFYGLWRFLVRYITPVAVIIVFLKAISVI